VTAAAYRARIVRRLGRVGLRPPDEQVDRLAEYVALLAKWNRKINLTAFDLDKPTDAAIDRLIVEPVAAAQHVVRSDLLAIDIGSGGGSPAIPIAVAAPHLRMLLVEAKTRKAAFLREAVRSLALDHLEVENRRLEELLTHVELHEAADLVTLRAVHADKDLWSSVRGLLRPQGRVFWFGGVAVDVPWPDAQIDRVGIAGIGHAFLIVTLP
jgi:16S rRNA (guanine527-N7)-methyltransferase